MTTSSVLPAYVFVEPLVSERVVLDASANDAGMARLSRAGARQVIAGGRGPYTDVADGSVDVVVCLDELRVEEIAHAAWLTEVDRVLAPEGFFVARVGSSAGARENDEALARVVAERFGVQDLIAERPFWGVWFSVAGLEDIAVNEDLGRSAPEAVPTHALWFMARGPEKPWQVTESLLVPVGEPPPTSQMTDAQAAAEVRAREASLERDALRESTMSLQDELDRRDDVTGGLRADVERLLRQIESDAVGAEAAVLDRQRAERRAAAAEADLTEALSALRRREVYVLTLERELARLRAKVAGS